MGYGLNMGKLCKEVESKRQRNSNIEFLRMFCMFIIIIQHAVFYSGCVNIDCSINQYWVNFFYIGGKLGSNCFLFVSAYYLVGRPFRFKGILKTHNSMWFYSIIFFILNYFVGFREYRFVDVAETLFPMFYQSYWFCSAYIGMLLISPFLNKLMDTISREQHKLLLVFLGALMAMPATILPGAIAFTDQTHIPLALFIYLLSGYVKKYLAEETDNAFYKKMLFVSLVIVWGSSFLAVFVGGVFHKETLITSSRYLMSGESIPMILASMSIVLLTIKKPVRFNGIINKISKGTLDVYLIHMNHFVYMWLWNIALPLQDRYTSKVFPLFVLMYACIVFCVSIIIGNVRSIILNYMESKFERWKNLNRKIEEIESILNK